MRYFYLLSSAICCLFFSSKKASCQPLSKTETAILKQVRSQIPYHLQLLKESVDINSGSLNIAGVKLVGEHMAKEFKRIGLNTEWVSLPDSLKRAGHLVASTPKGKLVKGKRLFLIGHLDTVFEPDMEANPYRLLNDSTATGQGVVDTKGGNIIILAALASLQALGLLNDTHVIAYFTGDEESTGHPQSVSRADFISRAQQCDVALGFETAQGMHTLATGRRGFSSWKVNVTGKQAHSAGIFSRSSGYGAAYELSRILNAFREQLSKEKYLTLNPGILVSGTELNLDEQNIKAVISGKYNIINPKAYAAGDLRFMTEAQKAAARETMTKIVSESLPETKATITFTDGFPAMEPKPGNYALVEEVNKVSLALGFGAVSAGDPGSRGAGDIAFVSPYLPGIDGLGASGSGAHAPGETINLADFPKLVERAALLIYRLTRQPAETK